jgi:hypothetical protein
MEVINTTSTTDPTFYYNYLNNLFLNPMVIIAIIVLIAFYLIYSSLGTDSSMGDSSQGSIFGIIIVSILVILILINALQYFFSINVTAYISNLFQPNGQLDIVVDQNTYQPEPSLVPEIKFRKQVFNIPGNYYNYENAKALCKAYGANLATYNQVENAYNSGGEWCNYGWSEGQMALFPTQQQTFDTLQKIPGHEHDCGRPGVNGGYIANPEVQFGVNCYGNKPRITEEENILMDTMPRYPRNMKDIAFDKKVDYWKNQISNILVSPFNHDMWTQI